MIQITDRQRPTVTWGVLIVGCGMIAGGYDEQNSDHNTVLSHAGAYRRHPAFRVVACVEPDAQRRAAFMRFGNISTGFATLEDALSAQITFDVVSVCTPTRHHAATLEYLVDGPQRLVFCKKPLTEGLEDAERLIERYRAAGKLLAVDYTRRWDSSLVDLARRIASGTLGEVQLAVPHYTKGVVHNGGHMIDLLTMLLGPLSIAQALRLQDGGVPSDPAVDAVLRGPNEAPVHLVAADWRCFELFEVQIVLQGARITISEVGFKIVLQRREENKRYPGYFVLGEGRSIESRLDRALLAAVGNIAEVLDGNGALACDGSGALAAQRLCVALHAWALCLPADLA